MNQITVHNAKFLQGENIDFWSENLTLWNHTSFRFLGKRNVRNERYLSFKALGLFFFYF